MSGPLLPLALASAPWLAPRFSEPLHQPGAGIPAGTDEMFVVLHLLSHGASWRTFDFLGFHHRMVESFSKPGARFLARWPSARAMQAARQKVSELTDRRLLLLPVEDVVTNLNRFLTGWAGYFRRGNSTTQFHKLDRYVAERLARWIGKRHKAKRPLAYGLWRLGQERYFGLRPLVGRVRYGVANATR